MKINNENIWITSDTHYNHKNICRGITEWRTKGGDVPDLQTRDFPDLDSMNAAIVHNINSVVKYDDVLIHLGDWSFGGYDSIRQFYDRLVCKNIYLYLGNHDHHQKRDKNGIKEIYLLVDKLEDEFTCDKKRIHMGHYPIQSWKDMKQGSIHLHGHTHLTGDNRFGKGKKMDVGIDGHPEFRPYNLRTEVLPLMEARPICSEYATVLDHHMDGMRNSN